MSKDGNIEKCRAVNRMHQDTEEAEIATNNSDMVRSKIFNFHSVRFIIIAKLKV